MSEADQYARQSFGMGTAALISAILFPVLAFALAPPLAICTLLAIPLGIIAMHKGKKARKMGSTLGTGYGLGIAALSITLTLIVVSVAWYVAMIGVLF